MGNRAVITTPDMLCGVYLHWNGGRDSVEGFLTYCRLAGHRDPTEDGTYALARLVQVVGNFFGGSLSVGVGPYDTLDCDNGDNGVYVVGQDWRIVRRLFFKGVEQHEYTLWDMLRSIDEAQPEPIGEDEMLTRCKMYGYTSMELFGTPDATVDAEVDKDGDDEEERMIAILNGEIDGGDE